MKQKSCIFVLCAMIICLMPGFSRSEGGTLREVIRQRMTSKFFPPRHLACLPKSKINDPGLEKKLTAALIKKYPEVKPVEIVRVYFTMENWRINRDEFTSFIRSRYLFTYVVIASENPDEYYVLELNFMQHNRFMGWLWHEIYLRSLLGVDLIRKENLDIPCQ
ncbi:MAG: hypothetical protein JW838_00110 [Spirochaetes bacterium]|nr:hypothetical protein [Spirochaetota bacterium]